MDELTHKSETVVTSVS